MVTKSVLYLQLVCSNPDLNFLLITVLLFAPGSTCSLLINCHLKGCCRVSRSFCYPHTLTRDENFKVFRLTIVWVVFMRTIANCKSSNDISLIPSSISPYSQTRVQMYKGSGLTGADLQIILSLQNMRLQQL